MQEIGSLKRSIEKASTQMGGNSTYVYTFVNRRRIDRQGQVLSILVSGLSLWPFGFRLGTSVILKIRMCAHHDGGKLSPMVCQACCHTEGCCYGTSVAGRQGGDFCGPPIHSRDGSSLWSRVYCSPVRVIGRIDKSG